MESIHQLFLERHSIRRYTDRELAPEDVRTILEAGLLAPSSKSARSWQFVVVENREMMRKLSKCKPQYAASLAGAPLAVVVCSSPERSEAYIEDASVAALMMQLQAADLGIGSCWVQVRGRYAEGDLTSSDYVQNLLGIPNDMPVECIITFGYSAETRKPVDPSKLLWEKVHLGTWNEAQGAE